MSSCDPIETVQFTAEEMKAACDVAADYGTYVMAHLYTPKAILRALGSGRAESRARTSHRRDGGRAGGGGRSILNPMPQFKKYEDMLGVENMPPKDEMVCCAEATATEILNRHEDIRLLFGTDMMITGPDYQVEQSEDIRYYEKRFGTMRALRALTGTANEVFALRPTRILTRRERSVCWRRILCRSASGGWRSDKSVSVLADTDHLRLIMKGERCTKIHCAEILFR